MMIISNVYSRTMTRSKYYEEPQRDKSIEAASATMLRPSTKYMKQQKAHTKFTIFIH